MALCLQPKVKPATVSVYAQKKKKALEAAATSCHEMTDYYPVLNKLERVIEENEYLRRELSSSMCKATNISEDPSVCSMLTLLLDCAKSNAGRDEHGKRYSKVIKELGYLIYSLGGLQLYEILSCSDNFPLPSTVTVKRMTYSKKTFREGSLRVDELKDFLRLHDLPMEVVLCEDATRVTGKIQYHPGTNQIIGFTLPLDSNGLPKVSNFPATSAAKIADYFSNCPTSNNAYCILAVPLREGAPVFCLCMFGTDNKFNSVEVHKRLVMTKEILSNKGW